MERLSLFLIGIFTAMAVQADMAGSADHPAIPRVAGSEMLGYAQSEYDAANVLSADAQGKLAVQNPEGARTRMLYVMKPGDTPTMVMRNYAVALEELGEVTEVYSCRNDCRAHTFSTTLWTRDTMLPTEGLPQTLLPARVYAQLRFCALSLCAGRDERIEISRRRIFRGDRREQPQCGFPQPPP